ncbi:uncharacterized protein LOC134842396 [Symsagittifera roscoffensis]|uniref:uncharacterized protein LOC134842396 n=1 Tax=Symsagittifera roscoffensis TaxID=84072 RepID=UPI00307C0035
MLDVFTMGIVYYKIASSSTNLRQTLSRGSISHVNQNNNTNSSNNQDGSNRVSIVQMTTIAQDHVTRVDDKRSEKPVAILGHVKMEAPITSETDASSYNCINDIKPITKKVSMETVTINEDAIVVDNDVRADKPRPSLPLLATYKKGSIILGLKSPDEDELNIEPEAIQAQQKRKYTSPKISVTTPKQKQSTMSTIRSFCLCGCQKPTFNFSSSITHRALRRNTAATNSGGCANKKRSSTENATYALFIISVGFIVFITPYTAMSAWQSFYVESTIGSPVHDILFEVSMLIFNGNFISNYYVYLLFNVVFRNYATSVNKKIFFCCSRD